MKYSFDVKISEHIWEDTLGQLICLDAIIAREGYQEYYEDDVLKNGSYKIIKIMRPWEEVLKSAPTFEAKPIVVQHPDKSVDITVKNIKDYKVGHMQNVRPSEHEGVKVLIADLVFDDPDAIKKVKSGELRELSCGYFYEIDTEKMQQYDIKGEHLALVNEGRAGIAKIIDSKEVIFELTKYIDLDGKEKKDEFMSKIPTETLKGIKEYYNENENERFVPEEVEFTIKIVDRELNKRNHEGMGLEDKVKEETPMEESTIDLVHNKEEKAQDGKDIDYYRGDGAKYELAWRAVYDAIKQYFSDNGITANDVDEVFVNDTWVEIKSKNQEKIKSGEYRIAEKQKIAMRNDGTESASGYEYELFKKSHDEKLDGGLADNLSIRDICMKHDSSEKFIRRQLRKGIRVELEHTSDAETAREIAMDHLYEMPNYYDKLEKMENEEKGQDLYIEDDDKISMIFDEKDLAWTSTLVKNIVKGDIISTINSIRPFEVTEIKKDQNETTLYLVSTDEDYNKKLTLNNTDIIDLLIISETGHKVRFDEKKIGDSVNEMTIDDLRKGDTIILKNVEYPIDRITKTGEFYDIYSDGMLVLSAVEGNQKIIIK